MVERGEAGRLIPGDSQKTMNLEEQVDKDFAVARRKRLLGRIGTRLRRDNASNRLLCFDEFRKIPGAVGRVYRGRRTVPVGRIGGSEWTRNNSSATNKHAHV
jgi:hypothetical protein